jgi:hypothetical protein
LEDLCGQGLPLENLRDRFFIEDFSIFDEVAGVIHEIVLSDSVRQGDAVDLVSIGGFHLGHVFDELQGVGIFEGFPLLFQPFLDLLIFAKLFPVLSVSD